MHTLSSTEEKLAAVLLIKEAHDLLSQTRAYFKESFTGTREDSEAKLCEVRQFQADVVARFDAIQLPFVSGEEFQRFAALLCRG